MKRIVATSIIVAVVLVILVVTVMGVNAYINRIRAGYIIQKTYFPAHTSRYVTYIRVNKIMVPQWHTVHHNDRWTFTIEDGDNRAMWDVRESVYNAYKVGDWFTVEEVIAN